MMKVLKFDLSKLIQLNLNIKVSDENLRKNKLKKREKLPLIKVRVLGRGF